MAGTRALRANVTIALGMLQFAVKLHSATEDVEGPTTLCHGPEDVPHALTKIKQTLGCPVCHSENYGSFLKAMDIGGGEFVPLPEDFSPWTEDELKALTNITLDIHDAVEVAERTLPGKKFYYAEPQNAIAARPYALLVNRVRERKDKAFVFEYAIRGVPAFYQLRVVNDVLCLCELARPELIRVAPVVDLSYNSDEIKMADAAIDALTTAFVPAAHCDKRKAALDAYVSAHAESAVAAVTATPSEGPIAPVLDLMGSLKASVDAAKAAKAPAKRAPRKRPVAKPAAKKAAPRKRTAKSA